MNILICGSRNWKRLAPIQDALDQHDRNTDTIIHGDCRGADKIADALARRMGYKIDVYPANWRGHGKGAGPMRNLLMLREGQPDVVYAFKENFDHTLARGGTENMVAIARKAGIRTVVVER